MKRCSLKIPKPRVFRLKKNYLTTYMEEVIIDDHECGVYINRNYTHSRTKIVEVYPMSILRFKDFCKNCQHLRYCETDPFRYSCAKGNPEFEIIRDLPFELNIKRFLAGSAGLMFLAREYQAYPDMLAKLTDLREVALKGIPPRFPTWQAYTEYYRHLWRESNAYLSVKQHSRGPVQRLSGYREPSDPTPTLRGWNLQSQHRNSGVLAPRPTNNGAQLTTQ